MEEYHDCSNCKHFDWVQDAKYFGHPCEIHGTAYSIGCKDYEEIPKKSNNWVPGGGFDEFKEIKR